MSGQKTVQMVFSSGRHLSSVWFSSARSVSFNCSSPKYQGTSFGGKSTPFLQAVPLMAMLKTTATGCQGCGVFFSPLCCARSAKNIFLERTRAERRQSIARTTQDAHISRSESLGILRMEGLPISPRFQSDERLQKGKTEK